MCKMLVQVPFDFRHSLNLESLWNMEELEISLQKPFYADIKVTLFKK